MPKQVVYKYLLGGADTCWEQRTGPTRLTGISPSAPPNPLMMQDHRCPSHRQGNRGPMSRSVRHGANTQTRPLLLLPSHSSWDAPAPWDAPPRPPAAKQAHTWISLSLPISSCQQCYRGWRWETGAGAEPCCPQSPSPCP